jgi:hypothetical protein
MHYMDLQSEIMGMWEVTIITIHYGQIHIASPRGGVPNPGSEPKLEGLVIGREFPK